MVVQCVVDAGKLTLVLVSTCHVLTLPRHVRFGGAIIHPPVPQTPSSGEHFCRPERLEMYEYGRSYEEGR